MNPVTLTFNLSGCNPTEFELHKTLHSRYIIPIQSDTQQLSITIHALLSSFYRSYFSTTLSKVLHGKLTKHFYCYYYY